MRSVCNQSKELPTITENLKAETKIRAQAIRQTRASGAVVTLKMTSSMEASRTRRIFTTTTHSLTVDSGLPLVATLVSKGITMTMMARIFTGHPPNQDNKANSKGSSASPISMKTPTTATILLAEQLLIRSMDGISRSSKEGSERLTITKSGVERLTRKKRLRISAGGSMRSGLVCRESMVRTTSQTSTHSRRTDTRLRLMRREGQKEKPSLESTRQDQNPASTPRIGRTCG